MLDVAPHNQRPSPPAAATRLARQPALSGAFIELHEIAKGCWKVNIVVSGKRIKAQLVLKTGHQNGEAKGVETAIQKHEVIGQRRKGFILL